MENSKILYYLYVVIKEREISDLFMVYLCRLSYVCMSTEAEGGRELVQHGILPSLAGGEWRGRCDLCCDGRSEPPALSGAAQLRQIPAADAANILLNINNRSSSQKSHIAGQVIFLVDPCLLPVHET
jgi:hypothetical protein